MGLFCLPHKGVQSGLQIHPPQQVGEARVVAEGVEFWIYFTHGPVVITLQDVPNRI